MKKLLLIFFVTTGFVLNIHTQEEFDTQNLIQKKIALLVKLCRHVVNPKRLSENVVEKIEHDVVCQGFKGKKSLNNDSENSLENFSRHIAISMMKGLSEQPKNANELPKKTLANITELDVD